MYQAGCGIGQKASNERRGTATEQTTTYHSSQKIALQHKLLHSTCQSKCIHVVPIKSLIDWCIRMAVALVRRYQMNNKRRRSTDESNCLRTSDASCCNFHHLHLDCCCCCCCCCLSPPSPLCLLFPPEVPQSPPASFFVHWVGPSDDGHQNNVH